MFLNKKIVQEGGEYFTFYSINLNRAWAQIHPGGLIFSSTSAYGKSSPSQPVNTQDLAFMPSQSQPHLLPICTASFNSSLRRSSSSFSSLSNQYQLSGSREKASLIISIHNINIFCRGLSTRNLCSYVPIKTSNSSFYFQVSPD